MPQRDGSPPAGWTERKDDATRRAFERFEEKLRQEFADELADCRTETDKRFLALEREFVTWRGFAVVIVPLMVALAGLAQSYFAPIKETVVAGSQKVDRIETAVTKRLDAQDETLKRQKADTEALLDVTLDGESPQRARKKWEAATGVPRIKSNP